MKDDSTNPDASSNHQSSIIDHQCSDTILAVSSAIGGPRSILRLSGPETLPACRRVFTMPISLETNGILAGSVAIDTDLAVDAKCYLFFAPHSYTGEDLAELHIYASVVLVEALVERLLASGLRAAGPGEFTARAYLNGKLDLAQAEAVNEIIAGSNRFQLNAAERLLSGTLTRSTEAIRAGLLDCLSLIEAGLDFSGEEIEFISAEQAAERLSAIAHDLEELLAGSIRYESLLELPSVGIAGAPNAGKSSLLNTLLGQERSLVSDQPRTTRDVLSGLLSVVPTGLDRVSSVPASNFKLQTSNSIQCVLFDSAGLLAAPDNILDRLAQEAAIEALQHCGVVLFCVDAAKADWSEDLSIRALVESKTVLHLATKADLLPPETQPMAAKNLSELFQAPFLPISSKTGEGLDALRSRLSSSLMAQSPAGHADDMVAMTTRHKQRVCEAIENVGQAKSQIEHGREEVAATLIRTAHEALAEIGQQPLDEQVLDRIFSRFCIGK